MKKVTVLMILLLSFAAVAAAQGPPGQDKKNPPAKSNITIKIPGLGCTTAAGSNTFEASSYLFGATQSTSTGTSGGGGGAGKATIQPLTATKQFDECSPALFGSVVTGEHLQTVDLVHQDDKGNTILTISLTEALITSYQIGGAQSSDTPQETISIDFRKICISESNSGNKLCFDRATNKTN